MALPISAFPSPFIFSVMNKSRLASHQASSSSSCYSLPPDQLMKKKETNHPYVFERQQEVNGEKGTLGLKGFKEKKVQPQTFEKKVCMDMTTYWFLDYVTRSNETCNHKEEDIGAQQEDCLDMCTNRIADYGHHVKLFGVVIGYSKPAYVCCNENLATVGNEEPIQPDFHQIPTHEKSTKQEIGKKRKKPSTHGPPMRLPPQEDTEQVIQHAHHNEFPIRKVLKKSDVNSLTRLLLGRRNGVADHILAFLDEEQRRYVLSGDGIEVIVEDLDTMSTHPLIFKYTKSMGEHLFKANWRKEFVERRKLQTGYEIGMALVDPKRCRFVFRVLGTS